jgi:hypothetical protein
VVDIRLSRSSDWTEPLNLYVAPVAVSGERKSAAVSKMTEPLRIIEAQLAAPWEAKAREAKTEQAFWGARVQTLQNDLKKAGMNGWDLARDLVEAQEKLDGATAPPKPKLLAESDTPERLEMRLAEQGGRIGIFSDEGGGVFALMSSYGEGSAKIDVYLRGHDGRQPLDSGRVKRDDVYVERPLLTVMVALQPSVVEDLAQHRAMRGRGLLARFLYGVPDSRIGYRETNPRPCPKDGLADYYNRIAALTMERPDTPHVISLDDDAQDIFDAWRTSHEARMRASGDLATMTDFGSKLPGLIGRIAGDFHMGLHGPAGVTKKVSAETIRQALGFDEYLIAHARLALGLLGASDQMTNARLILKWLTEAQRAGSPVERFGRKRALQATHLHADDLTSGLIMLVEYGWVKEKVGVREDGRPNRAAVTYEVHPSLTGQIGPDPGPPATPPNGVNGVNGLIEGSESSLSLKSEYGGTNQTAPLSPKPLKDRCDRWDRSEEGTDPNVGAHPPSCYCDECILDDRS